MAGLSCCGVDGANQSVSPVLAWVCGGDEQAIHADDIIEKDMAEHGRREAARMNDPKLPSKAEVEAHNLTHLPYRNWCKHCVRGRGKDLPHERAKRDTDTHVGFPWRRGRWENYCRDGWEDA